MNTAITESRLAELRRLPNVVAIGVLIVLFGLLQQFGSGGFPESWNIGIAEPINQAQRWVQANRNTHSLFVWLINPLSDSVDFALSSTTSFLLWLPWFIPPMISYLLLARVGKHKQGAVTAFAFIYLGAVGLWPQSIQTISLMAVSVAICILVGIPLGILSGQSRRAEVVLRPFLDAMQTVPATVYLIPVVLLFGIGKVPAAIATVIYALPPVVRLTALGIRQVPLSVVEAAQMFGSTRRQVLLKVQLPIAKPSVIAGINQTVMMALGIVVIASLVGAGGLGQEVMRTVKLLSPGRSMLVGLAVVAIAVVLDRVSLSFVKQPGQNENLVATRTIFVATASVIGATLIGKLFGSQGFPWSWGTSFANPVDQAVRWFRNTFDVITRPINDFIVRDVLINARDLINSTLAWQLVIIIASLLALKIAGPKMMITTALGLFVIGITGMWSAASDTLAQTITAVILSMIIAIPIGVWLGRHTRAEAICAPILDAFQTIPNLVYAIPFVMIFTVGPVPGVIAAVVYAIPPGIRLTSLGIKQVSHETIEAATTFGATQRQLLFGVRLPLALPSIILAVNQMIMMVLAMAIISGMVGGEGLGYRAVEALTRSNTGLGVEVGLAIVLMATILDRLTQALASKMQPLAVS